MEHGEEVVLSPEQEAHVEFMNKLLAAEDAAEQQDAEESNGTFVPSLYDVKEVYARPFYARLQRDGGTINVDTCIPGLNEALGGRGFYPGLHVIGGTPGASKTGWMLQMARRHAEAGNPVIICSYELGIVALTMRMAGNEEPGTRWLDYYTGHNREGYEDWLDAQESYSRRIYIMPPDGLEYGKVTAILLGKYIEKIREQEDKNGSKPCSPAVFIDYLQILPTERSTQEVRQQITQSVEQLASISIREHIPIISISSLSRASYKVDSDDPLHWLSVYKESGAVEYYAASAIVLKSETDDCPAQIILAKNRMGPNRGIFDVEVNGARGELKEMPPKADLALYWKKQVLAYVKKNQPVKSKYPLIKAMALWKHTPEAKKYDLVNSMFDEGFLAAEEDSIKPIKTKKGEMKNTRCHKNITVGPNADLLTVE